METNGSGQRGTVPFLLFRVGEHLCGLPLAYVIEVMRPQPIEPITGAPDAVKGLAMIRGTPMPVLDLALMLGGAATAATRFITIKTGSRRAALTAASVAGLHNLTVDTIRDIPPLLRDAGENAIAAIGALDAETLMVLNTAHLVPESVWNTLHASGEAS